MQRFLVLGVAGRQIDTIYRYSRKRWGETQAQKYVLGLFDCFQRIADKQVIWQSIPPEFAVEGYVTRYEKHFIFWRVLPSGNVGIFSVLDQRMDVGSHLPSDVKKI